MKAGKALNTRRAYASAWRSFNSWCDATGLAALPAKPQTLQDYATWCILENYRMLTVTLRMSAIAHYHEQAGLPNPNDESVREYLANARRHLKEQPAGKSAISYEMLRKMAVHFSDDPLGVRNRAMILLGFASGWRRSEIVALRYADLHFCAQGCELFQRYSKTDQKGEGRLVGIEPGKRPATCPIAALRAWLDIRGTWQGPLFVRFSNQGRTLTRKALESRGETLHHALKRLIEKIGEDPRQFGAHSLRSGMITEAAKHGASESAIKQRTGHKCSATLQRYIRPANVFEFNPLRAVL